MPREKMALSGAASLRDEELLAIFLRTGVSGCSVQALSAQLLQKHGSLRELGLRNIEELSEEKGMGIAKACQLLAAFELGARATREGMQGTSLDDPETIYRFLAPQMVSFQTEHLWVLLLDTQCRLLAVEEISHGGLSQTLAHPREILGPVISRKAHGFIIAHNHPSGNPQPSQADREVTRRIQEAAALMQVLFLDHLIIGRGAGENLPYYSFRENNEWN